MSKWNKPNKPLSEEFIENEERRKQIIIQAAHRRKEKERKIQQDDERDRRQEEQALKRHKQQKKDAYIKYLHNNLHDKYEHMQRMKKEAKPQIKSNAKWKKKAAQQNSNQLQALDLQIKMESRAEQQPPQQQHKQSSIAKKQHKQLIQQFQKEWTMQQSKDELLGSKLLDSLDLDIDTINRGKQVKQIMKEEPKNDEVKQLRQLIGYQSVLFAATQAQKQKKVQETKVNKEQKQIKETKQAKTAKQANKTSSTPNFDAKKAEINEVQLLNQLKRKKQAKILNWAIQQQQEAEDLFSNCSSKKKPNQALKQLNQELKVSKQSKTNFNVIKATNNLPIIAEETININPKISQVAKKEVQINIQPTHRLSKQKQTNQRQAAISTQPNFKKVQKRTPVQKEESAEKKNQVEIKEARETKKSAKTTSGFISEKNLIRMRTTSRQKPKNQSKQKRQEKVQPLRVVQVPKKLGGQLPPLPSRNENNTIATHDLQIDIESFIKQDLLNLNQQQKQIQQQLRQIHKNHKNGIKQIYNKFQIKTDYKHSNEIIGQQPSKVQKYYQNEQDIEQSLQNLDNMLIRKELVSRQKQTAIKEVTEEDSLSYINPFSNSEDLCNQVLKLAKNVSRFEKIPEQPPKDGYQYMSKAKKNQNFEKNQQKSRMSKGKEQQQQGLSQSQDVSHVSSALGKPPNILLQNKVEEKIHVNTKLLKNLLLDDD